MIWTRGVLEAYENGAANIFRSPVLVPVVEDAMVMDTTLEVVVKERGKREMTVVANKVVAKKVVAKKVVANMVVASKVVANMVVANMLIAKMVVTNTVEVAGDAFQCLTNFVMVDEEVVEVILVVKPDINWV